LSVDGRTSTARGNLTPGIAGPGRGELIVSKHNHVTFGKGVEYCEQCETLMIDVAEVTELACLTQLAVVQEQTILAVWKAFRKACPHRPVRELVVKGVG
jgi:hypothetical protein